MPFVYFLLAVAIALGTGPAAAAVMKGFEFLDAASATQFGPPSIEGFRRAGSGIAVNDRCFELIPEQELGAELQTMLKDGISCMRAQSVVPGAGTVEADLKKMAALLLNSRRPPLLSCGVPLPENSYAVGSSPGFSRNHPYIYVGLWASDEFRADRRFFRGIVFHELLHNTRYRHHPNDIEVTSGCEECCFGKLAGEAVAAACRVCGGKYTKVDDPLYWAELFRWDAKYYGRILIEYGFAKRVKGKMTQTLLERSLTAYAGATGISYSLADAAMMIQQLAAGKRAKAESFVSAVSDSSPDLPLRFLLLNLLAQRAIDDKDVKAAARYQDEAARVQALLRRR